MNKRANPSPAKAVRFDKAASAFGSPRSNKSAKKHNSDSPSASATNEHGCDVVYDRLRSVLCHPLGLPLLCAFNDRKASELPCLAQDQTTPSEGLDKVLSDSVLQWRETMKVTTQPTENEEEKNIKKPSEEDLTKLLAKNIEKMNGTLGYHAHAEIRLPDDTTKYPHNPPGIDVLLSPAEKRNGNDAPTTPYAVIGFGLHGNDWSKKLDQNIKCMDRMVEGGLKVDVLGFEKPILCGVVTIEDHFWTNPKHFEMKVAVFLCSRKDPDYIRMSLLWQDKTTDLENASKSFGRLLHVTKEFSRWLDNGNNDPEYKYLSTSCCKCKYKDHDGQDRDGQKGERDVVLRSYDNRVRTTTRNPEIYLDPDCQEKAGIGQTKVVLELFDDGDLEEYDQAMAKAKTKNPWQSTLWEQIGKRSVKIIATPYQHGSHVARTPAAFAPVIRKLKRLHDLGYVHGDIRAFNTVFGDDPKDGGLIDHDFGGKQGTACYPKGYKVSLPDGERIGDELDLIEVRDDWYALAKLIFNVHTFRNKKVSRSDEYLDLKDGWEYLSFPPSDEEITALENFLSTCDQTDYQPSPRYQKEIDKMNKDGAMQQERKQC